MSGRTRLLAIVAAALLALVAIDQLLLKGGGDGASSSTGEPTAAERYRVAAERLATKRAIIDAREGYERLLADADGDWDRLQRSMVSAGTSQVAAALLGDRVRMIAAEHNPTDYSASRSDATAVEGAPGIFLLELAVSMDLASPADAFRLIDRLENMPGLEANIVSVRLGGPGRLPSRGYNDLALSLTLQALAVVGEEG